MEDHPARARHSSLGALLRRAHEAFEDAVHAALAARGFPEIRPAHAAVFRHIAAEGSRLGVLAGRAGMTKQSMAQLVDGLEAAGHLRSAPDLADGRARILRLTPTGAQVQAALQELDLEAEAGVAGRIGRRRATKLRRALEEWATACGAQALP